MNCPRSTGEGRHHPHGEVYHLGQSRQAGWVAKDSMETVLGLTWNLIKAGVIWNEISAEQDIQNIILKKIKIQREENWSEMIRVKRKEKADRLSAEAREEELARQLMAKASIE